MFALFAGDVYYPQGGWSDLVGLFDSLEAAQAAFEAGDPDGYGEGEPRAYEWGQVVDLASRQVVLEF